MLRRMIPFLFFMVCVLCGSAECAEEPYIIISQKNLFNPERKEWKIEEEKKGQQSSEVPKKPPPPLSLELSGTIIVGDTALALIRNKTQSDKNIYSYNVGDCIGEYVISEIEPKKVVLSYYGEQVILKLHEGKGKQTDDKTSSPVVISAPGKETVKESGPQIKTDSHAGKKKERLERFKPMLPPAAGRQERKQQ